MSKAYNEMSYVDVAPIYNDINRIPLAAADDLAVAIRQLVGEGARMLDLGGGAGRISVPCAYNTRMIALDIEHHMLRASKKLAEERGIRMHQVAGTVLQTPFADNTFDAIITTNVLHQVEQWRDALTEASRILKPGGLFIIGRDVLDEESKAGIMRGFSRRFTAEISPEMVPTDAAGPALFQHLAQIGCRPAAPVTACSWTERLSPAETLDRMQTRRHNETWSLSDEQIEQLMARMRPWAEDYFDDLDEPEDVNWEFVLYPLTGLA